MATHLDTEIRELKSTFSGIAAKALEWKMEMSRASILNYLRGLGIPYPVTEEIHIVNALFNYAAGDLGFPMQPDDQANNHLNVLVVRRPDGSEEISVSDRLEECKSMLTSLFEGPVTPGKLASSLAENYLGKIKNAVQSSIRFDIGKPIPDEQVKNVFELMEDVQKGELNDEFGMMNIYDVLTDADDDSIAGYRIVRNPDLLTARMLEKLREKNLLDYERPIKLCRIEKGDVMYLGGAFWISSPAATPGGTMASTSQQAADDEDRSECTADHFWQISPSAIKDTLINDGIDSESVYDMVLSDMVRHAINLRVTEQIREIPSAWMNALADAVIAAAQASPQKLHAVLFLAAGFNKVDAVESLLAAGAPLNTRAENGHTALMAAVEHGSYEAAECLLKKGARAGVKDDVGGTAMHIAAGAGDIRVMELLRMYGEGIAVPNRNNLTVLHVAAGNRRHAAAELLLKWGANVDAVDVRGRTPLIAAAGDGAMATLLLGNKATVDAVDWNGWTALLHAAKEGSIDTVKMLLDHGANAAHENKRKLTALMIAASFGHADIVRKLAYHDPATIAHLPPGGLTALMCAADRGKLEAVRALIEIGAPVDVANDRGHTALHYAARGGYLDVARYLLEKGADPDRQNGNDDNALHVAALYGKLDMVDLLAERMKWLDIPNKAGVTPLRGAVNNGHPGVAYRLIEKGASTAIPSENVFDSVLALAAGKGYLGLVKKILEKPLDTDAEMMRREKLTRNAALHKAAGSGHVDVMAALLDAGADVNSEDGEHLTAMHRAASRGHVKALALLIDKGAIINPQQEMARTPLMAAAGLGQLAAVKLLIDKGARIDAFDVSGMTAPIYDAHFGHVEVLQALVQRRGDVDLPAEKDSSPLMRERLEHVNKFGETGLVLAVRHRRTAALQYLLDAGANSDVRARDGDTMLHLAVQQDDLSVLKILAAHANLNQQNSHSATPLLHAIQTQHPAAARYLIEQGADIHLAGSVTNDTPLIAAVKNGYAELVDLLLIKGAKDSIDAKNLEGESALFAAASRGNLATVRRLIVAGADVNSQDSIGSTPLHVAIDGGWLSDADRLDLVKALLDAGANLETANTHGCTPVLETTFTDKVEIFRLLADRQADIHATDVDGRTALAIAAANGSPQMMRELRSRGFRFDARDKLGRTVLMNAAASGTQTDIDDWIDSSDEIEKEATDKRGQTALHIAAAEGKPYNLGSLLQAKLNIEAKDEEGRTPLMVAIMEGRFDIAKKLIGADADVDAIDNAGRSPRDLLDENNRAGWNAIENIPEDMDADMGVDTDEDEDANVPAPEVAGPSKRRRLE